MRALATFVLSALVLSSIGIGPLAAAELKISVEIPQLPVAEYHRPYVAIWLARADHTVAANLAVWYQLTDGPEGEGTTWLKDMRQWWRRSGRTLELPVDGVTGATRPPSRHDLEFSADTTPLAALPEGDYVLHVEAAREVGGRELVRIPVTWRRDQAFEATSHGTAELGRIVVTVNPANGGS